MNYFIVTNNMQQGPFTIEELRLCGITSDTLVWAEGMDSWTPAWQVEELRVLFYGEQKSPNSAAPVPPPPPIDSSEPSPWAEPEPEQQKQEVTVKGRSRHGVLIWTGVIVVVLLIFMAITNPSKDEHRMAIKENVANGQSKAMTDSDADIFTQGLGMLGRMVIDPLINSALDNLLQYHNYVFFSSTSIEIEAGKPRTVSYGVFGKVFTSDGDAISKTLKKLGGVDTDSDSSGSSSDANDEVI